MRTALASLMLLLCVCGCGGQYPKVVVPDGHGGEMGFVLFAVVEGETFWYPSDAHPNATAAVYEGRCGALSGQGKDVAGLRYGDPTPYLDGRHTVVATDETDTGCANIPWAFIPH